jgi:hypothetical protein
MARRHVQIDRLKEEMACDIKLSRDTFIRMMSCLENVIYRGCKMNPPGIFDKYDEYKSGSIKALDNLRRQLKIQIKVFLASYQDILIKNNGKYSFPNNFPKEKVLNLIDNFKTMAINNKTGDDLYCQAIECIFKGEHDKVYLLLPYTDKNKGLDPDLQIKHFTRVNGKVFETTEKAIKEFREKGEIDNIVDIDEDKINEIINVDPINEVYRYFKLLTTFPTKKNQDILYLKIIDFLNFHSQQVKGYSFPRSFDQRNFLQLMNDNLMNYKHNQTNAFYYFSFIMTKILNYDYQGAETMLYYS